MKLPKTITLRLTKEALDATPEHSTRPGKKVYADIHHCLVCQSVRERFPDVKSVSVMTGEVTIDKMKYKYSGSAHEYGIIAAHYYPHKFKPFSIKLTRV